jgi:predicted RNA-binding protein with TRAM domain
MLPVRLALASGEPTMFSGDTHFSITDFGSRGSGREAVDGFSAIVAALDHGAKPNRINGGGIADLVAIGLGWLLLVAVVLYPGLQLAAVALCAVFMCLRPGRLLAIVLGSGPAASRAA